MSEANLSRVLIKSRSEHSGEGFDVNDLTDDLLITEAWADTSRLVLYEPLMLDRIDEVRHS